MQRHYHAKPAVTEEAAVAPQVMNTGRLPAVANPPDDDAETGDNHDDDGGDFKEREPEFQLTEDLHAHQVYGAMISTTLSTQIQCGTVGNQTPI